MNILASKDILDTFNNLNFEKVLLFELYSFIL